MPSLVAAQRPRWLFGPFPDLILGCGVAYLLVFLVLVAAGSAVRDVVPVGLLVLGGLLTGTPHYGATLLRVYERSEDRRGYRLFTVWATLAIAAAFIAGTRDARVAAVLFTIYVTWNAWHYTGQNYGIALMFLGRRGVAIAPREKRLVYATFVLPYVLIFLSIHGSSGAGYAPQVAGTGDAVTFLSLQIPAGIRNPAMAGATVAYLAALAAVGVLLSRRAAWRDLAPSALLVLVQAVWFVLPTLARASGTFQNIEPLASSYEEYAFYWVAYAHALQYLWITTYYATARDAGVGRIGFFWKSVLVGAAVWGIPALVFAPQALGGLQYEGGLFLLIASAVNIHHFVLDGAIWKLRDGRIARILIRSDRSGGTAPARAGHGLPAKAIWAAGAACAAIYALDSWERYFGYAEAYGRRDTARVQTAVDRLAWVGRDGPEQHYRLAELLATDRRIPDAMRHLRRSIELEPSARAWTGLAVMHEGLGEWREAVEAYDAALTVQPNHVPALYRSSLVLVRLGDAEGARARLERARAIEPANPAVTQALAQLLARKSSS